MGTQSGEAAGPPLPNSQDQRQECHKATESGTETEAESDTENEEAGERDRETSRGSQLEVVCVGRNVPPPRGKRGSICLYS